MRLEKLVLKNFRNYTSLVFEPDGGFNYIHGRNGAGKTNLLEAIYFLTNLRSFRRTPRLEMIAEGSGGMYLCGAFSSTDGVSTPRLEAAIRRGERKYKVNGKEEVDLVNYLGNVHATVFFPESLQIVKGSPSLRRAFFDRSIAAKESCHLADAREYSRLLLERNQLLKRETDSDMMRVWEQRLLDSAARIVVRRCRYLGSLQRHLVSLEHSLACTPEPRVRVEYHAAGAGSGESEWAELLGGSSKEEASSEMELTERARLVLEDAATRVREEERRRRSTLWGPHLDDFWMFWGDRRAREAASQGEQRLLMIILIVAAAEEYRKVRGEEPIILLDDLSSELDRERREAVLRFLDSIGAQVFITSTDTPGEALRKAADRTRSFRVEDGALFAA